MTIKNVVLNKAGLTLRFDPRKWSAEGGSVDTLRTWSALASNYPDVKFWIATKSIVQQPFEKKLFDLMFPLGNVEIMMTKQSTNRNSDAMVDAHVDQFVNWLDEKGVVPDAMIVDPGSSCRVNIPDTCPKADGSGFAKPATIAYAMSAPTIRMINVMKQRHPDLQWCTIHFDPKTDLNQADLQHEPTFSLSQMNHEHESKRYRNGAWTTVKLKQEYADLATAIVIGNDLEVPESFWRGRDIPISAAINDTSGTNGTTSRWDDVKMILDAHANSIVYGKWDPKDVPGEDGWRFDGVKLPGPISKLQLDASMKRWKFTVLSSSRKNWITQKFWESLLDGVIPIFAPSYDTQRNIAWPDGFRMITRDGDQLRDIMTKYEDEDKWISMAKIARSSVLTPSLADGTALAESIMGRFVGAPKLVKTGSVDGLWKRILLAVKESEATTTFEDFL